MRKFCVTIYRRVLVLSVIAMLTFPMLEIKGHWFWNFAIQERTQPIARPTQFWSGFVKHEWQTFLEERFLYNLGSFRAFLILSYNEAKHKLFLKRPSNDYIWTPEMGYYHVDTIQRLNYDVLHHDAIKQHYQRAAHRLLVLQELLQHYGITLLVVPAPPKVRLYPEYVAPYLIAPAETIMRQAVSYGDILEESGVNVLNVQRILTERKTASPWPFFTTTSFHWGNWAGCIVTNDIMRKAEELTGHPFFNINCSDVVYEKSKGADMDIVMILNIFSKDAMIGEAPFPKITPDQNAAAENHKIAVIGDSFSGQICDALAQALPEMSWTPDWLITLDPRSSLRQRFRMNGERSPAETVPLDSVLPEILTKDLVILEVSDGHVIRAAGSPDGMEFGVTRALLDGLLPNTNNGVVHPKNFLLDGWSALGNDRWHTTGSLASFAIRPSTHGSPIQLILDVENESLNQNKPRLLTILVDGQPIGQTKMTAGRGVINLLVPNTVQWKDAFVAEVSLQDPSGEPLDILLRSVRILGADAGKTAIALKAIQATPSQASDNTYMDAINLISNESHENLSVDGLSGLESNTKESWRWAVGPKTRIKFYIEPRWSDQARQIMLKLAFKNGLIPGQTIALRLNGEDIRFFSSKEIRTHNQIEANVVLATRKGVNILEFVFQDWNRGKNIYAPHDPRQLAVLITRLTLQGRKQ